MNQSQSVSSLKNTSESNLSKSADWGDNRAQSANPMARSFSGSTFQLPDINATTTMSSPKGSKQSGSGRSFSVSLQRHCYRIYLKVSLTRVIVLFVASLPGANDARAQ